MPRRSGTICSTTQIWKIWVVGVALWTINDGALAHIRAASRLSTHPPSVRGTPYASDARPSSASAPATSALFRNAFGRMTSYATCSRSHDVARLIVPTRPDISSDPPSVYDTYAVPYTYFLISDLSLISIISYIGPHLQVDPYPFLFGSPARYVCD